MYEFDKILSEKEAGKVALNAKLPAFDTKYSFFIKKIVKKQRFFFQTLDRLV